MQGHLPPLRRFVDHQQNVANLIDLERSFPDAGLGQQLAGIEEPGEIESSSRSEKAAVLRGQLLLACDPRAIRRRRQPAHPGLAQWGPDIAGKKVAKLVKFQYAWGSVLEGSGDHCY